MIKGKKVQLRAIESNDLLFLHKWANAPELQEYLFPRHFPNSKEWHEDWFQRIKNEQNSLRLIIDYHNIARGISSIVNIDWRNRHAWHGVFIGEEKDKKQGFAFDAIMTTMEYAFDEIGLQRLDGGIISYNEASQKLYAKCGWKREGVRREYYFTDGRFWDYVLVGITKEDYENVKGYWTI